MYLVPASSVSCFVSEWATSSSQIDLHLPTKGFSKVDKAGKNAPHNWLQQNAANWENETKKNAQTRDSKKRRDCLHGNDCCDQFTVKEVEHETTSSISFTAMEI